jgi:hypothetical protein
MRNRRRGEKPCPACLAAETAARGYRAARRPRAELLAPGHPLLDAVTDLIIERYDSLLKHGTMLVNRHDPPSSRGCWPYRGDLLQFCAHHDSEVGELTAASGRPPRSRPCRGPRRRP